MVYRLSAKPHSRLWYFLRAWVMNFILVSLVSLALQWSFNLAGPEVYGPVILILLVLTCGMAWLALRSWVHIGWFEPGPRVCFLTMVEEGLLIEVPAKGSSLYLPWEGVSYRRNADMLQIFTHGALRSIVSLNGQSPERVAAILSGLREHSGQRPARHGLFTPEKAAAPFAPGADKLPPIPPPAASRVTPPCALSSTVPSVFTNSPGQWQECLRLLQRPDRLLCTVCLIMIGWMAFAAGVLLWEEDWGAATFMSCFAVYFVCKLAFPGRRLRSTRGPIRMELTANEVYEYWDDGAWGRFRLPEPQRARLVRLPGSWCLVREKEAGAFLFDASSELPPPLAPYHRERAPRNGLRVLLAVLVLGLFGFFGYVACGSPEEPTEAELAFRALPPQPDESTLRAFVESHYASGELLSSPQLVPCVKKDGTSLAGYFLRFTETEPEPYSQDGHKHSAWVTYVLLYPDGRVHDHESWPDDSCSCDACQSAASAEPEE